MGARTGWGFRSAAFGAVSLATGAACVYDWTFLPRAVGADASDGADATGGDAITPPPPPPFDGPTPATGCKATADCDAGAYCDFADDLCGDGVPGTCRSNLAACPPVTNPEFHCGCDGKLYKAACDLPAAGVDRSLKPRCPLQPGQFLCGWRHCDKATEFCQVTSKPPGGDDFTCIAFSSVGCVPGCACLASKCSKCAGAPDAGGVTLTCP
jgi:hypothetical protein